MKCHNYFNYLVLVHKQLLSRKGRRPCPRSYPLGVTFGIPPWGRDACWRANQRTLVLGLKKTPTGAYLPFCQPISKFQAAHIKSHAQERPYSAHRAARSKFRGWSGLTVKTHLQKVLQGRLFEIPSVAPGRLLSAMGKFGNALRSHYRACPPHFLCCT